METPQLASLADTPPPSQRTDWRTGKPMLQHDRSFWLQHERRRVELGLSVPQYCKAHGLALSTFRHRVSGRRRDVAAPAPTSTGVPAPSFVEVRRVSAEQPAWVEVIVDGMTLRLSGAAAERVLGCVMARLS